MRASVALLTFVAVIAGCADDEPPAEDPLGLPTCALDEVRVVGTVGGVPVDESIAVTGHALVNVAGASPAYLDIFDPFRRVVKLQWTRTIACGETADARGFVSLPSRSVDFGNCESVDEFPSLIRQNADCDSGGFVLRRVRAAPYCTAASPLDGELKACWRFPP